MKAATLVIWHSRTGKRKWNPVLPAEVPEWVKDKDVLGRLVAGEKAYMKGYGWFRAEKIADSPILLPQPRRVRVH